MITKNIIGLLMMMVPRFMVEEEGAGGTAEDEGKEGNEDESTLETDLAEAADEILGGEPVSEETEEGEEKSSEDTEDKEEKKEGEDKGTEGSKDEDNKDEPENKEDKGAESKDDKPEDYSMPERLTTKASERFEKLVEWNKEKDSKLEQQEEVITGFRNLIQESGMSNEEFLGMVDIGKQIRTDPAEAIKSMQTLISSIAEATGIEVEPVAVDPLDQFPDLKEQVEDLKMTREGALEIARVRIRDKSQNEVNELTQQQRQIEERVMAGRQKVADFLAEKEKDIDWQAISPHLAKVAATMANRLEPEEWLGYIQTEYDRIKSIAAQFKGNDNNSTPLIDNGGRGSGTKVPRTLEELADQML